MVRSNDGVLVHARTIANGGSNVAGVAPNHVRSMALGRDNLLYTVSFASIGLSNSALVMKTDWEFENICNQGYKDVGGATQTINGVEPDWAV